MFYNIDDLYGMERKAADTYVDGSSLGGSTTYNPTITKLCADWRELQAQLAALTAEQEKSRIALANLANYCERSVTADDWELDKDTKSWMKECLEAKRKMEGYYS